MNSLRVIFSCLALGLLAGVVTAQTTPDFPPGQFTDGGQYQLSDCKGKLLVLYFIEPT
jgi:hypothetical protein